MILDRSVYVFYYLLKLQFSDQVITKSYIKNSYMVPITNISTNIIHFIRFQHHSKKSYTQSYLSCREEQKTMVDLSDRTNIRFEFLDLDYSMERPFIVNKISFYELIECGILIG